MIKPITITSLIWLRDNNMRRRKQYSYCCNYCEQCENNKAQSIDDHCCKFPITCYVIILVIFAKLEKHFIYFYEMIRLNLAIIFRRSVLKIKKINDASLTNQQIAIVAIYIFCRQLCFLSQRVNASMYPCFYINL